MLSVMGMILVNERVDTNPQRFSSATHVEEEDLRRN